MTETEPKSRLALCLRMLERAGIVDYNGHASIRASETSMHINIGSRARSRLTADDICTVDLEGTVLDGDGKPPLEFHLHAGIYKARPEVKAIVHAHPRWSTFLSMTGTEYAPVFAQGSLLYPVPVLDTPNSINSPEMAARLVEVLQDRPAALMKSHGAVTVGADITEAFVLINYLEENAERQYRALQIGVPYAFDDAERALCRTKLWSPSLFARTWDHFAARLEDAAP